MHCPHKHDIFGKIVKSCQYSRYRKTDMPALPLSQSMWSSHGPVRASSTISFMNPLKSIKYYRTGQIRVSPHLTFQQIGMFDMECKTSCPLRTVNGGQGKTLGVSFWGCQSKQNTDVCVKTEPCYSSIKPDQCFKWNDSQPHGKYKIPQTPGEASKNLTAEHLAFYDN